MPKSIFTKELREIIEKEIIKLEGFPCSKCGACCRRVGGYNGFPEPVNPDGSCSHLQKDNSCGIYETRPMVCRVEESFETLNLGITKEEYYRKNSIECNKMMDQDGVGEKIDMNIYGNS
jgi:Fe-S-cluster containining protein